MFDDTDFREGRVPWDDDDDWEDEVIYGRARNQRPATAAGGYQRRSDAVWDQARDDYLSGYTAEAVCARYGLKVPTFRSRAKREEWRRSDQPDPEPHAWDEADEAEDLAAAGLPDYAAMARAALVRADRAIRGGRDIEAARWLRMHERLSRLITDYNWRLNAWREEEQKAATPPAPEPAPEPEAPPAPTAAVSALEHAVRDAFDRLGSDPIAYAALEAQLTALEAALISDDSYDSDSVFSGEARVPSPLAGGEGSHREPTTGATEGVG